MLCLAVRNDSLCVMDGNRTVLSDIEVFPEYDGGEDTSPVMKRGMPWKQEMPIWVQAGSFSVCLDEYAGILTLCGAYASDGKTAFDPARIVITANLPDGTRKRTEAPIRGLYDAKGNRITKADGSYTSCVYMNIAYGKAVRACFKDEIENTVNSVLAHTDAPHYSSVWLSDTHCDSRNGALAERIKDTFNNIKAVCDRVDIMGISNTGDCVIPNDATITQEMSDAYIAYNRDSMLRANPKAFIVNGNHDGIGGRVLKTRNFRCAGSHNADYVHRDGENAYFYVDYPSVNLRVFYLDTVERDSSNNQGIGDAQLSWLRNCLLESEYDALFYAHIGPYGDFKYNLTEVRALLNAYHDHTGEFAGKKGRCIAYLCGHEHIDGIVKTSESGLGFPVVAITSPRTQGSLSRWYADYVPLDRKIGTAAQDAWDTVIYRPDAQKIYFARFGAGEDRMIDLAAWDRTK